MRRLILIVMALAILSAFVVGQTVPEDVDTTVISKIDQEHKNTRKFFSDELTRQRNEFFKQMDDRFDYYEETADSFINTAVWKLGLIWGSVTLFIFGMSNLLRVKLEQKRMKKLKESIIMDVRREFAENYSRRDMKPEPKKASETKEPVITAKDIAKPAKPDYVQRFRDRKAQDRDIIRESADNKQQNPDYSFDFEVDV